MTVQAVANHAAGAKMTPKARSRSATVSLDSLGLHPRLVKVLEAAGRTQFSRVHGLAIPPALLGRDVLAQASPEADTVGAFVLPVVHHLLTCPPERAPAPHAPRAILLAPAGPIGAMIAAQVNTFGAALGLRRRVALEPGAKYASLRNEFDILVATPAGLLDLMHRGQLDLDAVQMMVLARFDHMLAPDCLSAVARVIHHLPVQRQVLLFHAGLASYAQDLAAQVVRDPACVVASQPSDARTSVEQGVLHVASDRKLEALNTLLRKSSNARTVVFTRTKHGALAVARAVREAGGTASAMHESVSEATRDAVLKRFHAGELSLLATTDTSLREVEIGGLTLVVSYDLPSTASDHVARLARLSGEAGLGMAISLCSEPERTVLARIERQLGDPIPQLGEDFEPLPQSVRRRSRSQRTESQLPS